MKKVLVFAGVDNTTGAGVFLDTKVISLLGAYPLSIISSYAIQNTKGVKKVVPIENSLIREQFEIVLEDIEIDAIKSGMIYTLESMKIFYEYLEKIGDKPYIADTPFFSKNKTLLIEEKAFSFFKEKLITKVYLLTPNILELESLTQIKIETEEDIIKAAKTLINKGAKNVLVKGGHRKDKPGEDILITKDFEIYYFKGRFIKKVVHGTGCFISSAISSYLAMGKSITESISLAKALIEKEIEASIKIDKENKGFFVFSLKTLTYS